MGKNHMVKIIPACSCPYIITRKCIYYKYMCVTYVHANVHAQYTKFIAKPRHMILCMLLRPQRENHSCMLVPVHHCKEMHI